MLRIPSQRRESKSSVALVRLIAVGAVVTAWEIAALSGLFYRDVIPSLWQVLPALGELLISAELYWNSIVTICEVTLGLVIGGAAGAAIGGLIGMNRRAGAAIEPMVYYLAPTPKIVFFPLLLVWFGLGVSSKIAMAAIAAFFPITLSVAAGARSIDRVLIHVGASFGASRSQMAVKIYLPAIRVAFLNAVRLGLGVAMVATLLAETKLSKLGLGAMIMQGYTTFDMPRVYSLLFFTFVLAVGGDSLVRLIAGDRDPLPN